MFGHKKALKIFSYSDSGFTSSSEQISIVDLLQENLESSQFQEKSLSFPVQFPKIAQLRNPFSLSN